jgi:hypothetical protein
MVFGVKIGFESTIAEGNPIQLSRASAGANVAETDRGRSFANLDMYYVHMEKIAPAGAHGYFLKDALQSIGYRSGLQLKPVV